MTGVTLNHGGIHSGASYMEAEQEKKRLARGASLMIPEIMRTWSARYAGQPVFPKKVESVPATMIGWLLASERFSQFWEWEALSGLADEHKTLFSMHYGP